MRNSSRIITSGIVAALLSTLGLALAPAQAADRDGNVDPNELAFYFLSKAFTGSSICSGSKSDFATAKKTLDGYRFLSSGTGQGQYVKNNATCAYSWRDIDARVYYNSYCTGASDLVRPYRYTDLVATWNENASFKWLNGFDCTP
ncbi:MAG: hypothetical protein NTV23_12820 [Propionibacteriales bacterium]|nr:hypothetical protein [Propionibacteriales bacterium]